jgi:catechol 2,3-dioxygenase-like lactoylglutathione lyase family enzyme
MDPRISIVTLGVSDLAESTRFYRDGLGVPEREWDGNITFLETAGTMLAPYPRAALADDANASGPGTGFAGVTLAHNVATRAGVDAVPAEARAAGATVVKPADETAWGDYSG